METAAGLWGSSWVLPSRMSCNQFRLWLKEGRKSLTKGSHPPRDGTASKSVAEEPQVPGWFRKTRAARKGRGFAVRFRPLMWPLCCRWSDTLTIADRFVSEVKGGMDSQQTSSHTGQLAVPFLSLPEVSRQQLAFIQAGQEMPCTTALEDSPPQGGQSQVALFNRILSH